MTEVTDLVGTRLGADPEARFLGDLAAGALIYELVQPGNWPRIAELASRYGDLPLATVDASVVAAADRLKQIDPPLLNRLLSLRRDGLPATLKGGPGRQDAIPSRVPPFA